MLDARDSKAERGLCANDDSTKVIGHCGCRLALDQGRRIATEGIEWRIRLP